MYGDPADADTRLLPLLGSIVPPQVLLGDVGAGKSSLVLRFVKGQFVEFQVRFFDPSNVDCLWIQQDRDTEWVLERAVSFGRRNPPSARLSSRRPWR